MKSFSFCRHLTILVVFAGVLSCGCNAEKQVIREDESADKSDVVQAPPPTDATGNAHNEDLDAQELKWVKLDEEVNGFKVTLGHRGDHFHANEPIEPAVMIRKDDAPVTNAEVHVALLAAEGEAVIAGEVQTELSPATETDPAVYAKSTLMIPAETTKFRIRFRIKLPDVGEEKTLMIDVESH